MMNTTITITSNELMNALKLTETITKTKDKEAILEQTVRFTIESEHVYMTAHGRDEQVIVKLCDIKAADQLLTAVNAKLLTDVLKKADKNIDITLEFSEKLKVTAGPFTSAIPCMTLHDAEYSNRLNAMRGMHDVEVDAKLLAKKITAVKYCTAVKDDVRYYLHGMLLQFTHSGIVLVATDGHRLSYEYIAVDHDVTGECIVKSEHIRDVLLLLKTSDTVRIRKNDVFIEFYTDSISLQSKLIAGKFPDYRRVIPSKADRPETIKLDKSTFKKTLAQLKSHTNSQYGGIKLIAKNNTLRFYASNEERVTTEASIDCTCSNKKELKIGYNINYLIDTVSHVDSSEITLRVKGPNDSMLVCDADNETRQHIVMSIRL